jgi:hypothetical protein
MLLSTLDKNHLSNFGGKLRFILSVLFPERLPSTAATYIFNLANWGEIELFCHNGGAGMRCTKTSYKAK